MPFEWRNRWRASWSSTCSPFRWRIGGSSTTEYPFTKHIPIASSHLNACAMSGLESQQEDNTLFLLCGFASREEREQADLDHRAAPGGP